MTIDYSELRAKAEAATPGEWHIQYGDDSSFMCMTAIAASRKRTGNCGQFADDEPLIAVTYHQTYPVVDPGGDDCGDANSEYIAAANPAAILALLDELEALRAASKPAKPKRNDYPAAFDEVWAAYPVERQGTKRTAFKAWSANVKRGVEPAEMALGLRRYLAHAAAIGTETKYIKLAATFFGPDEHFSADWTIPKANSQKGQMHGSLGEQDFKEGVRADGSF